ncbi:PhnD/SsuA/transferrin family substrate-binding protein [bacterium]|nr:PhnD/SsuA/transferrin family substrate-binding protein [bacterium]
MPIQSQNTTPSQTPATPTPPAPAAQSTAASTKPMFRIRAAATTGKAHTQMFQSMKKVFAAAGQPFTWLTYDCYPNMLAAQQRGEVDVVFNGPYAHAKALLATGGQAQSVVMRDVDISYQIVVMTKTTSGINSVADLKGKTIGLPVASGCTDPGGNVMSLYYLSQNGLDLHTITVADHTGIIDSEGHSCASDKFVGNSFVATSYMDAVCIGLDVWNSTFKANPNLKIIYTSPSSTHCTWTSLPNADPKVIQAFHDIMLSGNTIDGPDLTQAAIYDGANSWIEGGNDFSCYTASLGDPMYGQLLLWPNHIQPLMPPGAPSGSPAAGAAPQYFPAGVGASGCATLDKNAVSSSNLPSFASVGEYNMTDGLTRYFALRGTPIIARVYDSVDSIVDANIDGQIDIAWNMPIGHARTIIRTNSRCRGILCRDVDINSYSVISVKSSSPISNLNDFLTNKATLLTAALDKDAAECSILPLHFLKIGNDISQIPQVQVEDDFGLAMLAQVAADGPNEGCATGFEAPNWGGAGTKIIWRSPVFDHCMMTVLDSCNATKVSNFQNGMLDMVNSPAFKLFVLQQNEGANAWVLGTEHDTRPYQDLITAIYEFNAPIDRPWQLR